MNTSAVQNDHSLYTTAVAQSKSSEGDQSGSTSSTSFQDAMARAEAANKQGIAEQELRERENTPEDMLKLALPSWFGQYLPQESIVNAGFDEEGTKRMIAEMNRLFGDGSQFTKDNKAPLEWRMEAHEFRKNHPSQQAQRTLNERRIEFSQEIAEYNRIGNFAMQGAYRENNITSEEYSANIKSLDPVKDEQVHQAFRNILMGNPRAVELMEILGLKALDMGEGI